MDTIRRLPDGARTCAGILAYARKQTLTLQLIAVRQVLEANAELLRQTFGSSVVVHCAFDPVAAGADRKNLRRESRRFQRERGRYLAI